ncbi:MAG: hypothetical protein PVJ60_04075 [Phycisphaerales bacterium]|jgi:tetratricopeptide (TPR) repeat protein
MKSEHRHELKTNELADWLGHLPQWTKQNLTSILIVLAIVIAVVFFFAWNSYKQKVAELEKLEFTTLLNQLSSSKMQVLNAQQDGGDLSFILLQPANNLATFAQNTKNDRMAALALIKRAEALRTELHYRPGTVTQQELTAQISQAEAAYTEAIRKSSADQSLIATAEFGLGLCAEELGNFDKAKQIYKDIVANPNLKGIVALAAAEYRLKTMDDYRQKIVFKPGPPPSAALNPQSTTPTVATQPKIQITPADPNMIPANLPIQITPAPNDVTDAGPLPVHGPPTPDNLPKVPEPNVPK